MGQHQDQDVDALPIQKLEGGFNMEWICSLSMHESVHNTEHNISVSQFLVLNFSLILFLSLFTVSILTLLHIILL